ncbi:hypothetical protein QP095_09780, partial [Aerococcus urinae]
LVVFTIQGILSALGELISAGLEAAQNFVNGLKSMSLGELIQIGWDWIKSLFQGAIDALSNFVGGLIDKCTNVWDSIKSVFTGGSSEVNTQVSTDFSQTATNVESSTAQMANSATNNANAAQQAI